jgi:serine/threonine-protein kinase
MVTAPGAPAAVAVGVGRLVSSDSIPVGGLTPGAVLADRYRIIGLLGRGGMGEVYRADDLKLGQPVALKFLPRDLSSDPVRRERFFAEVRITRQLAHPNICRVYDIAEVNGQHFLSMEFIDGEDLASLVKRIGYLPNEKGLEIARQLVAGLAAAHERGVLHRDLKPANIMIDGHGKVRITDFGLAIATGEEMQQLGDVAGTPAYMAPEQLAGKGASVRSDIYALGLVLYEILSGKRAFTAGTIAELRDEKEQSTPTAPSEIRQGIDPVVERLVMRCLERDPRMRPASVAQLAAALPGGDPLAAAIAAGETPSPELVAASGLKEGLRPGLAVALMAFVIVGSLAAVAMNRRTMFIERLPPGKPPDVLVERAREVIRKAGYLDEPADSAFGFAYDTDLIRYVERTDASADRWTSLQALNPVTFWYRQSPRPLERAPFLNWTTVTAINPPLVFSGEVLIRLDSLGRLMELDAVPPRTRSGTAPAGPFDWKVFFSEAGFDSSQWTPVEPQSNPVTFADAQNAWTGAPAVAVNVPLRVEAAAYRGRPVTFHIGGPWTLRGRDDVVPARTSDLVIGRILIILGLAGMGGGVFYARRNLRLGRGDRRGAVRIMLVVLSLGMAAWVLSEHHVATPWEFALFITALSTALFFTGLIGVFYIALEPFVRRRWPQVLVSWTRIVLGSWRDPLVGRDLLVGCATGIAVVCLIRLETNVASWFAYPGGSLFTPGIDNVLGPLAFVNALLKNLAAGVIFQGLQGLFLLFFLRMLLRNDWAAAVVWVVARTLMSSNRFATGEAIVIAGPLAVALAMGVIQNLLLFLVLKRLGFVAFMAALLVMSVFASFPMTFQASAWYAGYGYAALAIVAAIAIYGFRTSLGGRPLLVGAGVDD